MNIAIIGQGHIGSAMAHVLGKKRDIVLRTWDVDETKPHTATTCESAVMDAHIVIVAIPTQALPVSFSTLQIQAPKDAVLISTAKGLALQSNGKHGNCRHTPLFTGELLAEYFGKERVGVLFGPMLAAELYSEKIGEAVIAGSAEVGDLITQLFAATRIIVSHTDDMIGVSVLGALKNVYACGMGMLDGMELGANARGMFVMRAISEMQEIVQEFGGNPATVLGPAGIGDVVATGTSGHSMNYTFGRQLAHGESAPKGEGGRAVALLRTRMNSINDMNAYPLAALIADVIERRTTMRAFARFYE